ncbi:MAG: hypothetical protein LDL56_04365 [Armatimonadetes bacterium]|nr:hypothetical protein [Armatimonadota bacterium]
MPTPIRLGDIEAHEKLTARAYFLPKGEALLRHLGNIKEYSEAHEYTAVERVVAEGGVRRVNDEQMDVVKMAWELTLDELDADLFRYRSLSSRGDDTTQTGVAPPNGTLNIPSVALHRWYPLSAWGVYGVEVKVDTTPYTTGWELDAGAGLIKFTDVTFDGASVAVTFGKPAVTWENFTGLDDPSLIGQFQLYEYNQFSRTPLRQTRCLASLRVTEFPSQSGEFGTWKVLVTALEKPVIQRRSAAGT